MTHPHPPEIAELLRPERMYTTRIRETVTYEVTHGESQDPLSLFLTDPQAGVVADAEGPEVLGTEPADD